MFDSQSGLGSHDTVVVQNRDPRVERSVAHRGYVANILAIFVDNGAGHVPIPTRVF